jgi:hypothetical protein
MVRLVNEISAATSISGVEPLRIQPKPALQSKDNDEIASEPTYLFI